jgi:GH15 family glucan-1,4-alpha-glucosidase
MFGEIVTEIEAPSVDPGLISYPVNPNGSLGNVLSADPQTSHRAGDQSSPFVFDIPPSSEAAFPLIADYGLLSDCENTCLVAPSGAIEWLCLPRPHDPSVFGAILDRSAGSFRLGPQDVAVPANRRYVSGTMVLATTWQTPTGWMAVRDFLAIGPWHHDTDRSTVLRRTPGDSDALHLLVRTATCLHGTVDLVVDCEPSFGYGRADAHWDYTGTGYDEVATTNSEFSRLVLNGDLRFGIEGRAVRARHRLVEGESRYVALSWSSNLPPADVAQAQDLLTETNRFWRNWIDVGRYPDHPWREHLQRSALALKALTYVPTGAVLAAPTTSLPEHVGGDRNWDYRYTWVRDASFTMWALNALGFEAESDDFIGFLGDVLEPEERLERDADEHTSKSSKERHLRVLYAVDGSQAVDESRLDHLSGYGGSRPVRVGNAADQQDQLDIFGAVVDCIYQHTKSRDSLTERAWEIVVVTVEAALRTWQSTDRSIWEVRGEPRHFTYSKIMCWVAADRGARLAALRGDIGRADRWRKSALEIHQDVCQHGVDAKGRFVQSYGSTGLDASLLLIPLVRFLPPEDDRVRATVMGIAEELTEDGFVHRYRAATSDDGLDCPETTFTVCSFWLVSALVEIGEVDRAGELCGRLLQSASHLYLYGEELDPTTSRHLGNFPQALTHLSLINAVLHVIEAERQTHV